MKTTFRNILILFSSLGAGYIGGTLITKSYLLFRDSEIGNNPFLIFIALLIAGYSFSNLYKISFSLNKIIYKKLKGGVLK